MKRLIGAPTGTIKTHLFIICPNNSGSNILRSVFAQSAATWNLRHEGQHTAGFCGPSTRGTGARLLWASNDHWLSLFSNEDAYDWQKTRNAWHEQAYAQSSSASVFVTSSPPFLLQVAALSAAFPSAKFVYMVRNPYAVVEGISRRADQQDIPQGEDIVALAAQHVMQCLELQKANIERNFANSVFFSYETLCKRPESVAAHIKALVPELDDLDFGRDIPVKGIYREPLRDMNEDQISRLTRSEISRITAEFSNHLPVLDYFGYDIV